jgi:hypothetical protein
MKQSNVTKLGNSAYRSTTEVLSAGDTKSATTATSPDRQRPDSFPSTLSTRFIDSRLKQFCCR